MKEDINSSTFPCINCGADLTFEPGTSNLKCSHCGTENEIQINDHEIEELDFHAFLNDAGQSAEHMEIKTVKCNTCGASSSLEPNIQSASCAYCSSPLILESATDESIIQPKSILPFKLKKEEAKLEFKKWVKKLWFAPNKLKKASLNFDHFKGMYIPYWTYDSETDTWYWGQRGEHYYVTENYTTTENGKTVNKTRQVQKTRWYNVNGQVNKFFNDILVVASNSLPKKHVVKLEPWDLENLAPFDTKYLSGFLTEKYQINLEEGFNEAKGIMETEIDHLIRRDIGGDEQRIIKKNTNFDGITFKHILLPVYVSAYRFKNKVYRFMVNARTGEVHGERPWSAGKIALLVIAIIAIAATIYFATQSGAPVESATDYNQY